MGRKVVMGLFCSNWRNIYLTVVKIFGMLIFWLIDMLL